jgi:predicted ribonuclease toxin of YeeF-YezG toxin-antitoxin module
MGSKVLEASTLKAATGERAHQYERLREQFQTLKKEFAKIVDDSNFQGNGAEAIKGFYQGQIDVVDAWIQLIDINVAFFKGIPGDTEDADLSGDTVVQVPFLEENVERAGRMAKDMVADQQDALQHIFSDINDLVSLSVFSKDAFDDQMDKAERSRAKTVEKVNELDKNLTDEYAISQGQEQYIYALFAQLMEATRQGETISPLYFNAEAYHNSEVYKAIAKVRNENTEYITFKKDQKEAREIQKKMEEMENRPWYEKTWDTVCTFTGEVTGYYDSIRATTGVDPVTGRKLSEAERITAGAMAAAGFIPVIGWAGRAVKGGSAIYKTVRAVNAADHMLDSYKTAQGLSRLQKAEYGIYGLVSANGFSEYFTGKDMFGNELTEEQRNQSLFNAFAIAGVGSAGYALDRMDVGKMLQNKFPYSTHYAKQKAGKAQELFKTIRTNVGNTRIPVNFRVEKLVTAAGHTVRTVVPETKTARELMQQATMSKGTGGILDNVDFSKLDDTGVKALINDINKSSLTPRDKVQANIKVFYKALEAGIKTDVQVLADVKIIDSDTGKVKWPPAEGYEVDEVGNAIKKVIVPKVGDTIDRYGSAYGTYTSPINDGKSYSFEQRALPYIENPHAYHQYEVIRDFSELKNVIENWPDELLKEEFYMDAKAYGYDIENFNTFGGKIASAFGAPGGGIQWNLPISVEYLKDFGFLRELK